MAPAGTEAEPRISMLGPQVATPQASVPSGGAPTCAALWMTVFSPMMAYSTDAPSSMTAPGIMTL